ncbi:hypothetical protein [Prescottella subtropica]|uniref:hypothetical protein n=1 Tax=Prescottella subtropica TaxID=2545757 RepID=UPI0010F51F64|nr:hypothetical protein [Prescottella subtropica]
MTDTAIGHLTDWTHWHWAGMVLLLAVFVVLVAFSAGVTVLGLDARTEELTPMLIAAGAALVGYIGFVVVLGNMVRHLPSIWATLGTVALAVFVISICQKWFVDSVDDTKGRGRVWQIGTVISTALGLVVVLYDAVQRLAAWLSMGFGALVMFAVVVALYSSMQTRR